MFGDYDTIFDTPGDDCITGSSNDDTLFAGWGSDTVLLAAGDDRVFVHESEGDTSVIYGFDASEDLIILRGYGDNPAAITQELVGNDIWVDFGSNQHLLIKNQVDLVGDAVKYSKVHTQAWSGTNIVDSFDPAVDIIEGLSSIGFNNISYFQSGTGVVFGVIDSADGMWTWTCIKNFSTEQLLQGEIFLGFSGHYTEMHSLDSPPLNTSYANQCD
jgi:hypothetical protein